MAVTLSEWLLDNQESFGVVASATTDVGCGVGGMAPGNDVFDDEVGESCARWRSGIPDVARAAEPDVTVVAQFASREPPPGVAKCDTTSRSWFGETLGEEVRSLQEATQAPVVLTTIPYNRTWGVGQKFDGAIDCLNEEIRAVGERRGAPVLELGAWVCPTTDCRLEEGGTLLRPDGLHFEDEGAGLALRWILDRLYGSS